jgi:hypothetical protein
MFGLFLISFLWVIYPLGMICAYTIVIRENDLWLYDVGHILMSWFYVIPYIWGNNAF